MNISSWLASAEMCYRRETSVLSYNSSSGPCVLYSTDLSGKSAYWFSSGMNVLGVVIHFLFGFEVHSTVGIHSWHCET